MINEEIIRIRDKLKQTIKPDQIYLFGSYAKDTFRSDSDYDFYIVVPDDSENTIKLSQKAYRSLKGLRKNPVDIVIGCASTFDKLKYEETLEKIVSQEGILLYEK